MSEDRLWEVFMFLGACGVSILGFMSVQLWNLNGKMATIVEKITTHEDTFKDHENRLRRLERI